MTHITAPEVSSGSLAHRPPIGAGLDLTFELLATVGGGVDDRLADTVSSSRWLVEARGVPTGITELTAPELRRLRRLRDDIRSVLHGKQIADHVSTVTVQLGSTGSARFEPAGGNGHHLASAVLLEIAMAQHDKKWPRVKLCRNPSCEGVFYDRSRNNSGVWHDVKTCGNLENLRASRARRRAADQSTLP